VLADNKLGSGLLGFRTGSAAHSARGFLPHLVRVRVDLGWQEFRDPDIEIESSVVTRLDRSGKQVLEQGFSSCRVPEDVP
jgi:hypothetical protein